MDWVEVYAVNVEYFFFKFDLISFPHVVAACAAANTV
jgi:hypothetical protein